MTISLLKILEDAGLTTSGKVIPSSSSQLYDKDAARKINKTANHIKKAFPHFNRKDHEEAARHHQSEASKSLLNHDYDGFSKSSEKASGHSHLANQMFNSEIEADKKNRAKQAKADAKASEKTRKVLAKFTSLKK